MFTSFSHYQDEEDELLARQVLEGSTTALSILLNKHRPLLLYIFYHWCGSHGMAGDMVNDLHFKLVVNIGLRPAHTTFRLWLYQQAISYLQQSNISPLEQLIRSRNRQDGSLYNPSIRLNDMSSACTACPSASFDCKTATILSLNRPVRIPFIFHTLIGIKPLLGARIMNISRQSFAARVAEAKQQIFEVSKKQSKRTYSLCPFCFKEGNNSLYHDHISTDTHTQLTGIFLPSVKDWLMDLSGTDNDQFIDWLRRSFIQKQPNLLPVCDLLRLPNQSNPYLPN